MNLNEDKNLQELISKLQTPGDKISLSKFVSINLPVLNEIRKLNISLKEQAEIVSKSIKKPISMESLTVAISRLNKTIEPTDRVIIEKKEPKRFVDSKIKLILGTQKQKINESMHKDGTNLIEEKEKIIDWRGLAPNESVSSWIIDYREHLVAINFTGWRWSQIAEAINEHLNLKKKISKNTLTSIISLTNKKIIKNK